MLVCLISQYINDYYHREEYYYICNSIRTHGVLLFPLFLWKRGVVECWENRRPSMTETTRKNCHWILPRRPRLNRAVNSLTAWMIGLLALVYRTMIFRKKMSLLHAHRARQLVVVIYSISCFCFFFYRKAICGASDACTQSASWWPAGQLLNSACCGQQNSSLP